MASDRRPQQRRVEGPPGVVLAGVLDPQLDLLDDDRPDRDDAWRRERTARLSPADRAEITPRAQTPHDGGSRAKAKSELTWRHYVTDAVEVARQWSRGYGSPPGVTRDDIAVLSAPRPGDGHNRCHGQRLGDGARSGDNTLHPAACRTDGRPATTTNRPWPAAGAWTRHHAPQKAQRRCTCGAVAPSRGPPPTTRSTTAESWPPTRCPWLRAGVRHP